MNCLSGRSNDFLFHEIKELQWTIGSPIRIFASQEKSWKDEIGSKFEPIFFILENAWR